jgi:hypothetical protein
MSNSSLISSCCLQFEIKDHNQALGGMDRLTFTECSILSYSSFTASAFNVKNTNETSHKNDMN